MSVSRKDYEEIKEHMGQKHAKRFVEASARTEAKEKKEHVAKKMHTFSFLTKKGFRTDAKGSSAKEAYPVARSVMKHYAKNPHPALKGDKLSGTYFKYDREGLHANEGAYSQYRPSKFRKADKH